MEKFKIYQIYDKKKMIEEGFIECWTDTFEGAVVRMYRSKKDNIVKKDYTVFWITKLSLEVEDLVDKMNE